MKTIPFVYGNSGCHDLIERNGIINKPKAYLLNEMIKSHIVTMIRKNKMNASGLKNPNLVFNDITESQNIVSYL